jgi:hypothetical protein
MEWRMHAWKNVGAICAMLALAPIAGSSDGGTANPAQTVGSTRSGKTLAIHRWHPHFGQLPILFEPNVGQAAPAIEYVARSKASAASSGSSGGGGALGWSLIGVLGLELAARRRRHAVLAGGR